MYSICKEAEKTHEKQLLGTFYTSTGLYKTRKAIVYVATGEDYRTSYFYMRIVEIVEIGVGVKFRIYEGQTRKECPMPIFITTSKIKWEDWRSPDYVFLTKEEVI